MKSKPVFYAVFLEKTAYQNSLNFVLIQRKIELIGLSQSEGDIEEALLDGVELGWMLKEPCKIEVSFYRFVVDSAKMIDCYKLCNQTCFKTFVILNLFGVRVTYEDDFLPRRLYRD